MPDCTPGPWHIYEEETENGERVALIRDEDFGDVAYRIVNGDGESVGVIAPPRELFSGRPEIDLEQLHDNARLMAAAPELRRLALRIADLDVAVVEAVRRGEESTFDFETRIRRIADEARRVLGEVSDA